MEVYELAVNRDFEHTGIGTELVKFAYFLADHLNRSFIGIRYLTVCADKEAVPFYEKMHFGKLEEYGEIPRDQWNQNCVPMFVRLPSVAI